MALAESLPDTIQATWEIAKNPCGFCENNGKCIAKTCRDNIRKSWGGRPTSVTAYPTFVPKGEVFGFEDSRRSIVEEGPKKHSADMIFLPTFLNLAKAETRAEVDINLILRALRWIYNNQLDANFENDFHQLLDDKYQNFCNQLVDWGKAFQCHITTDLFLNMAVMIYNLLNLIRQTAAETTAVLAFPAEIALAAA